MVDQALTAADLYWAFCNLLSFTGYSVPQPLIGPINIFRHCEDEIPLYDPPKEFPSTLNGNILNLKDAINNSIDKVGQKNSLVL